uniref:Uncharacterized protein n=1 Tax=Anopheles culicifacies TaxID=139723 RepID=A0A182MVW8_9DIPT
MEIHVKQCKQRNKRRERAQRMIAERDKDAAADGTGNRDPDDSADDDSGPVSREKPHRPPVRRKRKEKEPSPVLEEDIIDGFAILAFKTYEDIEFAIKVANKRNEKRLSSIVELTTVMVPEEKPPKIIDTTPSKLSDKSLSGGVPVTNKNNNSINNSENHSATVTTGGATGTAVPPVIRWVVWASTGEQRAVVTNLSLSSIIDPGTSDDSGRASERLTTSSVAQRDPDSSRDRLSDASSRCSSGKGYICDSEGDDDKVSHFISSHKHLSSYLWVFFVSA